MREHTEALARIAELFGLPNDPARIEAILPIFKEIYRHIVVLREIDVGDVEPGIGLQVEIG